MLGFIKIGAIVRVELSIRIHTLCGVEMGKWVMITALNILTVSAMWRTKWYIAADFH
jgi:hypothetical protein